REPLADAVPHVVDRLALDDRIGPGEVDPLEHAVRALPRVRDGRGVRDLAPVENDDLAGSEVAEGLSAHQLDRDRLARYCDAPLARAEDQRSDPQRIAAPVDLAADEEDDGVASDQLGARPTDRGVEIAGTPVLEGDRLGHRLGVRVPEKLDPLSLEPMADPFEVDDVPVVGDRGVLVADLDEDRLGVLEVARAGGRVTDMPHAHRTPERVEQLLAEDLVDEAHPPPLVEDAVAGRDDTG